MRARSLLLVSCFFQRMIIMIKRITGMSNIRRNPLMQRKRSRFFRNEKFIFICRISLPMYLISSFPALEYVTEVASPLPFSTSTVYWGCSALHISFFPGQNSECNGFDGKFTGFPRNDQVLKRLAPWSPCTLLCYIVGDLGVIGFKIGREADVEFIDKLNIPFPVWCTSGLWRPLVFVWVLSRSVLKVKVPTAPLKSTGFSAVGRGLTLITKEFDFSVFSNIGIRFI